MSKVFGVGITSAFAVDDPVVVQSTLSRCDPSFSFSVLFSRTFNVPVHRTCDSGPGLLFVPDSRHVIVFIPRRTTSPSHFVSCDQTCTNGLCAVL